MSTLRSHPHLLLEEHVARVLAAGDALLSRHSPALSAASPDVGALLRRVIRLHDLGKASRAFQEYIPAPAAYRGSRDAKRHTPLSMLAALLSAETDDWQTRLAVTAAVAGHHQGFLTYDQLEGIPASTTNAGVLGEQLATLPWSEAAAATGLSLTPLDPAAQPWLDALEALDELQERLHRLPVPEGIRYRLRVQLLLSLILEADKALLAIAPEHVPAYLGGTPADLPPAMVERLLRGKRKTRLDGLRRQARRAVLDSMAGVQEDRLFTATLPTGAGKTLIGASWALRLRERLRTDVWAPQILIVLPYLSIIDQTQQEYGRLLTGPAPDGREPDPAVLLASHSLAERVFDPEMDGDSNDFFLDTWRSEIVVTTFDQFLFALLSPAARHQMRFHHLADALIVMDEVQTLPCILWHPVGTALAQLTRLGEARVLAVTATQPGFLGEARELAGDPEAIFSQCRRYRILLRHGQPLSLEEFCGEMARRLPEWEGQRVLITLNTRRSARAVRDALADGGADPVYFITADVTPKDRLESIQRIKKHQARGEGCVVVSTQCIEAGVDIDMDRVIRDFGPLDSIVQVAGRCNRNNEAAERATVEIYDLRDENRRAYAGMVYDTLLLQATRQVLGDRTEILEEEVFAVAAAYFDVLRRERNTGESITRALARWEETDPVRQLLRGKQAQQVTFVVEEEDEGEPGLREALDAVAQLEDRWERRRAHRALAGRLARISVSVYARNDLDPADYADRDATGIHWLLRPGYYEKETGLDLRRTTDEPEWGVIL